MAFLKNINAWKQKSEAAKKKIKSSATLYVQNKVLTIYKEALKVSPQWSGNYAYNWTIEFTGYKDGSYEKRFKVTPWQALYKYGAAKRGDPEAINAALANTMHLIEHIKWNSAVKLVNNSPIADRIEAGTVKLRPENVIPGGQGVIAHLQTKYGNYFKGK